MAARSSRIDALRGFAVFGILLMNVWSFVYGYSLYRYPATDAFPLADQLSVLLVAAFAEQKFYPIFAFLFGAGFALQTGAHRAPGPVLHEIGAAYRRRLRWLLACGLLHGSLVWFGDILTMYAVTGFWLAPKAGRPLRELAASLRILAVVNLVLVTAFGLISLSALGEFTEQLTDARRVHLVYTQGSWSAIALERLQDFGVNLFGFFFFVPHAALLFLLGVFALRLGYLTRPERHRAVWRKVLVASVAIGVPINAWWALSALRYTADPLAATGAHVLAESLLAFAGPALAAAYIAAFMLTRKTIGAWLVPVGKMALTNYLMQSLTLMFLLQGSGLGLGAVMERWEMLALCFAIMPLQLLFSRWWLARHQQGPVEAAWRRYSAKVG